MKGFTYLAIAVVALALLASVSVHLAWGVFFAIVFFALID